VADEEVVYEDMTVEELQDELRARNLPVSGNKAELIARLDEDDAAATRTGEGEEPPPEPGAGVDTVVIEDAQGNDIEVEAGRDGENPVSPENPPEKAVVSEPPAARVEGEAYNLAPEGVTTVTISDNQGGEVMVEAGMDGENPVSPNNPVSKASIPYEPPAPPPLPELLAPEFEEPDTEEGEVLVTTAAGQPIAVEAGMDDENPVSAENPPEKAVLYDPAKEDEDQDRARTGA
jgi:hypothetical protein